MQRRRFITLLGAAGWPFAARAQQPGMPVVGYLRVGHPDRARDPSTGWRRALREAGFIEGQNFAVEIRVADRYDQLPELAAEQTQWPLRSRTEGASASAISGHTYCSRTPGNG